MSKKYRLTEGRVTHADGVYEEGDTFEASESTVRVLGDRLEPVDGDGEADPEARKARSSDISADTESGEGQSPSVDDDYDEPAEGAEDPVSEQAGEDGGDGESEGIVDDDYETPAERAEDPVNAEAGEDDAEDLDYDSMSVSEVEQALEEHDFSDEELDDLLEYEQQNKNRKGAKEAIEAQQ